MMDCAEKSTDEWFSTSRKGSGKPSQGVLGAVFDAFHAEDAFRAVLSVPRVVGRVHIHGAYPLAFPAADAFILVAFNAEQGEIAHGLEEHGDRADVLAERPVVLKGEGLIFI